MVTLLQAQEEFGEAHGSITALNCDESSAVADTPSTTGTVGSFSSRHCVLAHFPHVPLPGSESHGGALGSHALVRRAVLISSAPITVSHFTVTPQIPHRRGHS